MDMKHIENQLLIERYLQGRLSTEEEARFEEALVASPELLDQLEAAERLQGGLKDLSAVEGVRVAERRQGGVSTVFASPRYALAASVLLAVSVVFGASMYRQNQALEGALAGNPAAPAVVQALYNVRSASPDEPVNIVTPTPGGQVVLLVDPGFEPYDDYRGTLMRLGDSAAAEPVHQVEGLVPGYEEMLALALPSRLLTPGNYEIRIEGHLPGAAVSEGYEPVTRVSFLVR